MPKYMVSVEPIAILSMREYIIEADNEWMAKRMSGIYLAIPVFSKGYRPKQGKVVP